MRRNTPANGIQNKTLRILMNMCFCKRTTKHKLNWLNLFNNLFMLAIILLTTNVDANLSYLKSTDIYSYSCDSYKTCSQCIKASNCSWLFKEQKCDDEKSIFSDYLVVYSGKSCPQFSVSMSKEQNNDPYFSIIITILNQTENIKTYLENGNISCNVENTTHNALLSDGKRITCNSNIKKPDTYEEKTINSFNIFYFTITVNGIQLQFDNPKDHYLTINFPTCDSTHCAVSFWNDGSRKYYCKWCMKNNDCNDVNEQKSKCDIRAIKDNAVITDSVSNIEIKGSDVVITDFTPTFALSAETIVMNIFIKNNLVLIENRNMTVTVAGRKCDHPTAVHGNEVVCTVPKGEIKGEAEGPVEVMYSSSTNYTLKSQKNFTFFNPTVINFKPTCGSVDGNTSLTVTGTFFNVTRDVQVSIGDIDCEIKVFDYNHIDCLTGKSDKPHLNVTKIKFNNRLTKKFKASFAYVNTPTVEKRQNIMGIVSGGTKMQILGNFSCVNTPRINVNCEGKDIFESCDLVDDRKIICVAPKFERKPDRVFPMSVPFRLHMEFSGRTMKTQELHYQLYPDPIFIDFEVNGTTIHVNGMFLNLGYRPDDLSIQVQYFNDTCNVLFADVGLIICQGPSTLLIDSVQGLIITVGQSLKTVIGKKLNPMNSRQFQMATVLSGISIISVFVALVFGLLFCYKIILTNSKQQTEKRYMEELQNITAGMEDKRF